MQDKRAQEKLDRLLDLYTSGGLKKKTYLDKQAEYEREMAKRAAERADLEAKLADYSVLTPDEEAELRQFQADVARRMTPNAPFEGKVRLLEILRVECVYDAQAGELVVAGLMGGRTLKINSRSSSTGASPWARPRKACWRKSRG